MLQSTFPEYFSLPYQPTDPRIMSALQHLVIILTIMLGFGSSSKAQLTDSIAITTNGSWIIERSEGTYNPYGELTIIKEYAYYRSGGDTLINGLWYTKLLKSIIYDNNDGTFVLGWSPYVDQYFLAYRNDMNKRAYKVSEGSTIEELWYDFNYSEGDTVWSPNTVVGTPYLIYNTTDSVEFCGISYESRNFDGYYDFFQDYFNTGASIQRVGSTTNFFYNYSGFIQDRLLYFCEESTPFQQVAGIEETKSTHSVRLFPNPAKNIVHITSESGMIPKKVVIQNLAGEIVFQDEYGSTSFSIENFSSGVYLVTVEFDDSMSTVRLVKE